MISPATSRTWATEPAAEERSTECSVCTESITHTSGRSCSSVASTACRSVSAMTGTASASPPPSRCARSRIWAADSSADTYSVRRPAAHRLASAIVVSVDFPMPGAPPISTREPGTIPPPSTLSSSPIPVLRRSCSTASTSASATGLTGAARSRASPPPPPAPPRGAVGRTCSTSVFHSPQPGQRPAQRAVSWPQAEQTWTEVGLGMARSMQSTGGPRRQARSVTGLAQQRQRPEPEGPGRVKDRCEAA